MENKWLHAAVTYAALTFLIFKLGLGRQLLTGLQIPALQPGADPKVPRPVMYM